MDNFHLYKEIDVASINSFSFVVLCTNYFGYHSGQANVNGSKVVLAFEEFWTTRQDCPPFQISDTAARMILISDPSVWRI